MSNIKKIKNYTIGFIVGIATIGAVTFAADNGLIGDLFENVGSEWKLLGSNIKNNTITNEKVVSIDGSKIDGTALSGSQLDISKNYLSGSKIQGAVLNATNATNATNAANATGALSTTLSGKADKTYVDSNFVTTGSIAGIVATLSSSPECGHLNKTIGSYPFDAVKDKLGLCLGGEVKDLTGTTVGQSWTCSGATSSVSCEVYLPTECGVNTNLNDTTTLCKYGTPKNINSFGWECYNNFSKTYKNCKLSDETNINIYSLSKGACDIGFTEVGKVDPNNGFKINSDIVISTIVKQTSCGTNCSNGACYTYDGTRLYSIDNTKINSSDIIDTTNISTHQGCSCYNYYEKHAGAYIFGYFSNGNTCGSAGAFSNGVDFRLCKKILSIADFCSDIKYSSDIRCNVQNVQNKIYIPKYDKAGYNFVNSKISEVGDDVVIDGNIYLKDQTNIDNKLLKSSEVDSKISFSQPIIYNNDSEDKGSLCTVKKTLKFNDNNPIDFIYYKCNYINTPSVLCITNKSNNSTYVDYNTTNNKFSAKVGLSGSATGGDIDCTAIGISGEKQILLEGNKKTWYDCENAGGTVIRESDGKAASKTDTGLFCKFESSTCKSGWTQYNGWAQWIGVGYYDMPKQSTVHNSYNGVTCYNYTTERITLNVNGLWKVNNLSNPNEQTKKDITPMYSYYFYSPGNSTYPNGYCSGGGNLIGSSGTATTSMIKYVGCN